MGVSYPSTVAVRARELHEAGWNLTAIGRIIGQETKGAHCPSRNAVRSWVDPDYAEAERLRRRTGKQHKSRRKAWQFVFERIQELRKLAISYRAIAVLISHDFEISLTTEQVERILQGRMRESTMARLLWPKGATS